MNLTFDELLRGPHHDAVTEVERDGDVWTQIHIGMDLALVEHKESACRFAVPLKGEVDGRARCKSCDRNLDDGPG